jgi:hypothetical protein
MKPTEVTAKHVIATYFNPARSKRESTVQVRVGNVQKELGWTNRTPSVFSTLGSKDFHEQAGVELIEKRGGPPSGGPSTTVVFQYRLLPEREIKAPSPSQQGGGFRGSFLAAYGICRGMYREDGGAEAFIRAQRENFGSVVSQSSEGAGEQQR